IYCEHSTCSRNASIIFSLYRAHRVIHSFPTRRSSDLTRYTLFDSTQLLSWWKFFRGEHRSTPLLVKPRRTIQSLLYSSAHADERSEEHTSELQSRFDLVCRLLLEINNYIILLYSLNCI